MSSDYRKLRSNSFLIVRRVCSLPAIIVCCLALTGSVRAGFLYAVNQVSAGANQIYGFSVNESTGALTLLGGFPVASGGNGDFLFNSETLTIDRANRRLYVINDGSDTVSAFSIGTGGALTALPFSPIALGTGNWATIAVHPSGSPLVVGGNTPIQMLSFNITAIGAAAAAGSPYLTGSASPFSTAFSRDGSFVYTGGNTGNNFAGFSVNQTTGILTPLPGSPFDTGAANPVGFATDSQSRLFSINAAGGTARIFTAPDGIPVAATSNPFASGLTQPVDGVLSPNENFYYAADRNGSRVGGYGITGSGAATTLAAVAGSPVSSGGTSSTALVLNNSGGFLYAANGNSRNISTYSVNINTGVATFGNVQAANTLGAAGLVTAIDYLPSVFTVNNLNDSGAGSLRQAVADATAAGGGIVTFAASFSTVPQTIQLISGQITISNNITIQGTGANLLTVQNTAPAGATSRVFNLTGGTVNLNGLTITGGNLSSGNNGGGILTNASVLLTLNDCAVSGNTTVNFGGGIETFGRLNVNNSTVSGNTASFAGAAGGGIDVSGGIVNISNSTISGNAAPNGNGAGGGILAFAGVTNITNSTVTNNSTPNGGGGVGKGSGGTLTIRNSIIAGNQNNGSVADVFSGGGAFVSNGFNLVGNVGAVTGFVGTDITGTGASPINPQLTPLALNGGTTLTHALLANSPAIDKGNNSNITADQREFVRVIDNALVTNTGNGADIGAFERQFVKNDFDGDGRADVSVFRPTGGFWYLLQSTSGFTGAAFGVNTDKIVPADYDGDGRTDIAVYRNGTWFLQRSTLGFIGVAFGAATDIPQPADFDGDGRAELCVFRPSNGSWFYFNLVNNQTGGAAFGQTGDKPVIGDYDGDNRADLAVNRSGTWFINRSSLGFTGLVFGDSADKLVPADYDGDGKTDVAVFRPSVGTWFLQRSQLGFTGAAFGLGTDLPTPADFDGDGKSDIAVFRTGSWFLLQSTSGFTGVTFGQSGDLPIPNAFVQ